MNTEVLRLFSYILNDLNQIFVKHGRTQNVREHDLIAVYF